LKFEPSKEPLEKMTVQDKTFVELEYVLTLDSGQEMDRSAADKPLGFIFGARQIVPGLEKKLQGMQAGESAKLLVEAAEGYGVRDESMIRDIPRKNFPDDMNVEVGMIFQAQTPYGPTHLKVVEVSDDNVKGDFNHPLAGERLTFDVKVIGVREATEQELAALASCETSGCGPSGCSSCGT
jgi:FKBP-type peptidyl-prolyl cis-trans isomerase SlyD